MERLYNVSKAAELLGIHRKTVYEWEKDGKFKFKYVDGKKRVSENDIKRLRGE